MAQPLLGAPGQCGSWCPGPWLWVGDKCWAEGKRVTYFTFPDPTLTHLVVPTALEVTSAESEAQSGEVTGLQAQHQEGLEVSPQLPMMGHESPNPLPTGDRRVLSGIGTQADVCLQHLQLFYLHQVPQQIR